jgi:hypothetical protein
LRFKIFMMLPIEGVDQVFGRFPYC